MDLKDYHIFFHRDCYYLFQTETASAYRISPDLANYVRKAQKDLSGIDEETRKKIYRVLRYSQRFNHAANESDLSEMPSTSLSGLSLNVAQNCNMRCKYCYGADGTYSNPGYMSYDTAIDCINWLVQHTGRDELSIVFFGGEPLLNFKLIQKVCYYIKQAKHLQDITFIYSITTNGTLLNKQIIRFLNEHHFNVTISFDGDKKAQNLYRPMQNGRGSYRIVCKNIQRLFASSHRNVTGRATLTSGNSDWQHICRQFSMLGFKKFDYAVVTDDRSKLFSLSNIEHQRLCSDLERQADELIELYRRSDTIGSSRIWNMIAALNSKANKAAGCGAGRGILAVSYEGELFPCHRFVGNNIFSFGSIYSPDYDWWNRFADMRYDLSETCRSCWARLLCGGGCLHDNLNHSGKLYGPDPRYCHELKKRIEMAIYAYDRLKGEKLSPD